MASKVYFTDFRTGLGTSLTVKLQKLIRQAGIGTIDFDGKLESWATSLTSDRIMQKQSLMSSRRTADCPS